MKLESEDYERRTTAQQHGVLRGKCMKNRTESLVGLSSSRGKDPWSVEALELERLCYSLSSGGHVRSAVGAAAVWLTKYSGMERRPSLLSKVMIANSHTISTAMNIHRSDLLYALDLWSVTDKRGLQGSDLVNSVFDYVRDSISIYCENASGSCGSLSSHLVLFAEHLAQYGWIEQARSILAGLNGTAEDERDRRMLLECRAKLSWQQGLFSECIESLYTIIVQDRESGLAPDIGLYVAYVSVALRSGHEVSVQELLRTDSEQVDDRLYSVETVLDLMTSFNDIFIEAVKSNGWIAPAKVAWPDFINETFIDAHEVARLWCTGWQALSSGQFEISADSFASMQSLVWPAGACTSLVGVLAHEGLAYTAAARGFESVACSNMLAAMELADELDMWSGDRHAANVLALARWAVKAFHAPSMDAVSNGRSRIQANESAGRLVVSELYMAEGDLHAQVGKFVQAVGLYQVASNLLEDSGSELAVELALRGVQSNLAAGLIESLESFNQELEKINVVSDSSQTTKNISRRTKIEGEIYFSTSSQNAESWILQLAELENDVNSLSPEWVLAHLRMASSLAGSGDNVRAISLLKKMAKFVPNEVLGVRLAVDKHIYLARHLMDTGSYALAAKEFDKAKNLFGKNSVHHIIELPELNLLVAHCLALSGQFVVSRRRYQEIILELESEYSINRSWKVKAHLGLGQCLEQLREHTEAAREFKKVLNFQDSDPQLDLSLHMKTLMMYAWNLELCGDFTSAVEAYENALTYSRLLPSGLASREHTTITHRLACCSVENDNSLPMSHMPVHESETGMDKESA